MVLTFPGAKVLWNESSSIHIYRIKLPLQLGVAMLGLESQVLDLATHGLGLGIKVYGLGLVPCGLVNIVLTPNWTEGGEGQRNCRGKGRGKTELR